MTTQALTSADQEALRSAAELHGRLARAAAVARTNALGYGVFGVLSLLAAVLGSDLPGLGLGAVLTGVAIAQVRAAPRLRRGDPVAPRFLARNELLLMGCILVYCVLQLTWLRAPGGELETRMGDLGAEFGELADSLNRTLYASVLGVTLLYQGGLALYFLRRRPDAERYLAESPAWARAAVESLGR